MLALKCHFTFDHDTCPKPKKRMLDWEAMKSMKFFKTDQVTWAHHSEPWDNNIRERAKRKKKIFKERHQLIELTPTPPSSPIRSPPTAHSEPLGLSENLLPEPHAQIEPNIDSIPHREDWIAWRNSISSDLEELKRDIRELKEFVHGAISFICHAMRIPGYSIPRGSSPLPTTPSTRVEDASTPFVDAMEEVTHVEEETHTIAEVDEGITARVEEEIPPSTGADAITS
ncbi:unnamed protein product [Rhodiola kirilowii]